jgi:hypothetical protein
MTRPIVALLAGALLAGCSTAKPVLYNNDKFQQAGREVADHDIAECKALADQAEATEGAGKGGKVAKGAGVGTVVGAAGGAAGGAIWGSAGQGAASGAVAGLVGGLLWPLLGSSNLPSDVHMNYVNQCLADRGYQVAGWK